MRKNFTNIISAANIGSKKTEKDSKSREKVEKRVKGGNECLENRFVCLNC